MSVLPNNGYISMSEGTLITVIATCIWHVSKPLYYSDDNIHWWREQVCVLPKPYTVMAVWWMPSLNAFCTFLWCRSVGRRATSAARYFLFEVGGSPLGVYSQITSYNLDWAPFWGHSPWPYSQTVSIATHHKRSLAWSNVMFAILWRAALPLCPVSSNTDSTRIIDLHCCQHSVTCTHSDQRTGFCQLL